MKGSVVAVRFTGVVGGWGSRRVNLLGSFATLSTQCGAGIFMCGSLGKSLVKVHRSILLCLGRQAVGWVDCAGLRCGYQKLACLCDLGKSAGL